MDRGESFLSLTDSVKSAERTIPLRRRWNALFADARRAGEVFDRLVAAYAGRHYHNLDHVADCLHELDAVADLADDRRALELAIWFHDVVYDATRPDNEARSADRAANELALLDEPRERIDRVQAMILDTRHAAPPATGDGRLLVDIDLAGLAAPPERFDRNTRLIRREFAHLADEHFRKGRAAFLAELLQRQWIYHTAAFRAACEKPARQNLARAVAALADGQ